MSCKIASYKTGGHFHCTRNEGHEGPCAAVENKKSQLQETVETLRNEIAKIIQNAQSQCPHEQVGHRDGAEPYGTYHPQRICTNCGLIETGGWWCYSVDCSHWHEKDYKPAVLGPKEGRTIFSVSEKEFNFYRI